MSTIKSDRTDFEKLLNGLDPITPANAPSEADVITANQPVAQPVQTVVDSTSAAETMQVKMLNFDYDGIKKGLRKKARKTILGIVKHIIPNDIIDEEYVQDKIEQDIETLADLYMKKENNVVMQRSIMEQVNAGNAMPRNYEVFGQLTDKIQSINKQIFDTEQRMRKTYVDLKYEIRDKIGEDFATGLSGNSSNVPKIENQSGMIVTSTRNLIAGARQRHIDKINNTAEAEFKVKQ